MKRGDIVAVVETQKGAIEIEIFETGQVDQMLVSVGTKVPVGTHWPGSFRPRGRSGLRVDRGCAGGGTAVASCCRAEYAVAGGAPATIVAAVAQAAHRASPAARRLALIRGIDLGAVVGRAHRRNLRVDVERVARSGPSPTNGAPSVLTSMRCALYRTAMARSKREILHY